MNYPYKCYYLRLLANSNPNLRCRKPAWEITEQMKEWLSENVNDYYWSAPLDYFWGNRCYKGEKPLYESIYFKK
jgi:hypothetical protein